MPQQPIYALTLSREQAEMLNAALSHYLVYLKQHPDSDIREVIPHVEVLQQALVGEVRTPTVPAIDVKTLAMLSQMNHARALRLGSHAQEAQALFAMAHSWLTIINSVSVHFSDRDQTWHFGREDGPQHSPSEGHSEATGRATVREDVGTREPL